VTLSLSLAVTTYVPFDLFPGAARGFAIPVGASGPSGGWSSAELLDGPSADAAPFSLRSTVLLFFLSRGEVGEVGDRMFGFGSGGDTQPSGAAAAEGPFEELTLSIGILLPVDDGYLADISGLSRVGGDPSLSERDGGVELTDMDELGIGTPDATVGPALG
jgi:hypothetical protein